MVEDSEEAISRLIERRMGAHAFNPGQLAVVKQVISATADFDFAKNMVFHPVAVEAGVAAIRSGSDMVVDVQMVDIGIQKERLMKYGGSVWCFTSDEDVIQASKKEEIPRDVLSMRKAAGVSTGAIYVIGNAPSALSELIRLTREGRAKPLLIIGVPIGLIAAEETKEELLSLPTPFITCRGCKGGNAVAVAIVNALALLASGTGPTG